MTRSSALVTSDDGQPKNPTVSACLGAHHYGPEVDPTVYHHAESHSEPCVLTESEDESETSLLVSCRSLIQTGPHLLLPTMSRTLQRTISMAT